jgi:hypothetical protein
MSFGPRTYDCEVLGFSQRMLGLQEDHQDDDDRECGCDLRSVLFRYAIWTWIVLAADV